MRRDEHPNDEVRVENCLRRIVPDHPSALTKGLPRVEGGGGSPPRADLANGQTDISSDHARVSGTNLVLQAFDQQAKLQLRRDHGLEKLQPVLRVQRLDLLG